MLFELHECVPSTFPASCRISRQSVGRTHCTSQSNQSTNQPPRLVCTLTPWCSLLSCQARTRTRSLSMAPHLAAAHAPFFGVAWPMAESTEWQDREGPGDPGRRSQRIPQPQSDGSPHLWPVAASEIDCDATCKVPSQSGVVLEAIAGAVLTRGVAQGRGITPLCGRE